VETGFRANVAVTRPTRLDCQFAVSNLGKDAARLSGNSPPFGVERDGRRLTLHTKVGSFPLLEQTP
jgi:hypothetical protein